MKKDRKHMAESQRCRINAKLNEGCRSFAEIAKDVGVDPTTVSREIKGHMVTEESGCYGRPFNDCSKRRNCPVSFSCDQGPSCRKSKCVNCSKRCFPQLCEEYEKEVCDKLKKPPYVCNGCKESSRCTLEKHYYKPVIAQHEYETTLSESRQVIHVTQEQIEEMDHTLASGCRKKQSINHMCSYAGDAIPVCGRTVYNYISQGLLPGVRRVDLPKAVKYRRRRKKSDQKVIENREIFIGRTYADYLLRVKDDPSIRIIQLDTVEGPRNGSGAVLMTLEFPLSKLQLAFLLEAKTSENVIACFREIENMLGPELYKEIFQLILTDRGTEFSNPGEIEKEQNGDKVLDVYFCDPRHSEQKGACEKNHVEIRKVAPKGTDFARFSQEKIDLMMSHVNSYSRPSEGNKTAYELFCFYYENGEEILSKLGIKKIDKAEVDLSPALLN